MGSSAGVTINGNAKVTAADIAATNGVVHIIDAVLIPPKAVVKGSTTAPMAISNLLPPLTTKAPGACESWCSSNSQDWGIKCKWTKFCAGCSQCPRACKTWCAGHRKQWQSKCTWKKLCDGCWACSEVHQHAAPAQALPTTRASYSIKNAYEPVADATDTCSLLVHIAATITITWIVFVR